MVVETLAERWGSKIEARRVELGFTQTQLASLCDVTQQTISKVEAGQMIPHDRLKAVIADRLMVEPGELFNWPPRAELGETG